MVKRTTRLDLTRTQILAFRRFVQALDARLPHDPSSLRQAAWAGLQDSMPRAALLPLHARVEGTTSTMWEAPCLVQLWGPLQRLPRRCTGCAGLHRRAAA
jgi:hypothetical protein